MSDTLWYIRSMDTTKFSSLIKRSKVGDYLFIKGLVSGARTYRVTVRSGSSGRGGYTYIKCQSSDRDVPSIVIYATDSYNYSVVRKATRTEIRNWCATRGEAAPVFAPRGRKPGSKNKNTSYSERNREEQAKERQRVADYFASQRTASNPMPATEVLVSDALRQKVADLELQLQAARFTAERNYRLYEQARATAANVVGNANASGKVSVSKDVMQFLRFSGISEFPCSPDELKKGRVSMLLKLHPDTTGKDSNAQMVSAMRGFDHLTKLIGG